MAWPAHPAVVVVPAAKERGVVPGMELLPLLLIVVAFWFLLIRPQRRRQQELARTQRALGAGDEVMLGAGIYGTVRSVGDDTLELEVAPGTTVRVARAAVVRVVTPVQEPGVLDDPAAGTGAPAADGAPEVAADRAADDNDGRQDRG